MIRFLRLGCVLGGLWLCLLATTSGALAHAALDRSEPAAGAVLPEPPADVRIWFTEPLEPRFTRADLLDASGQPVPGASSAIAPANDHELVLTLPPDLPDGGYTVAWRNVSSADGHNLQGYFGIRIGEGGAPGVVPAAESMAPASPARELSRGLALIGLALLLAIAPVTLGVLTPVVGAAPDLTDALVQRLRRYAAVAIAVALLGSVAALIAQAASIAPDLALPAAVTDTLTGARYGELWAWRLLGLLVVSAGVIAALWGPERWQRQAMWLAAGAGLVAPLPFSLLSHAAAQPEGASAAIAADALHLLAASIWGGGVVLLAAVLLPVLRGAPEGGWRELLGIALPRFSALGLAAWGILWLSGLYAAWLQVGSLPALTETPYGRTLLLKGALLLPVLLLAAAHFWQGRALDRARLPRLAATLALEAALVIAVLLVVGRLIGQPPARETLAERAPTALQVPLSFPTDAGPRAATLNISPGAPGDNAFTLDVAGDPLPAKTEAVLRVLLPGRDLGEQELRLPQTAPNQFTATGTELALAGDWQLTAIVRQIGAFTWTTQQAIALGASPPAPPVVNPPPRFGGAGIAGMLLLAAGCVGVGLAIARGRAWPRASAAAGLGALGLAAGFALLLLDRMPAAALVPETPPAPVAVASPTPAAGMVATPAMDHDHMHEAPAAATPAVALPGVGTPVSAGDLRVTLDADTRYAAPTDLTLTVTDDSGAPVTGAKVVVFTEMAGMSGGHRESLPAEEQAPGVYVAPYAPLTMPGAWEIVARVSPKGQPSATARFGVEVGGG